MRTQSVGLGRGKRLKFAATESPKVMSIVYRICGDNEDTIKLAKQHLKLKEEFPTITLPESIVYLWLSEKKIEFQYQAEVFGGRLFRGGAVPDFILMDSGLVLRVQGDYWHQQTGQKEYDLIQEIQMLNSYIAGRKVTDVIDLWESRLLSCQRDRVIQLATLGIELGRA